jgi:hypothetical protein
MPAQKKKTLPSPTKAAPAVAPKTAAKSAVNTKVKAKAKPTVKAPATGSGIQLLQLTANGKKSNRLH